MDISNFEKFYSDYYDKVFRYILKKTADFHLSEDIAMDTFTACYKHFQSYDETKASLGTWVYTIASNKLKNYYRDRKEFDELDDNSIISNDMEDMVIEAMNIENLRDILADALETLNETQQMVVVLKYFKNKNSSEISTITGLSSANVRAIASRAVQKLKDYFDKLNIDY